MSAWRDYNVFIAQTESTDRGDKERNMTANENPAIRAIFGQFCDAQMEAMRLFDLRSRVRWDDEAGQAKAAKAFHDAYTIENAKRAELLALGWVFR